MDNLEFKNDYVIVKINKTYYSKKIILSSVFTISNKNYILLDSDETNYYVKIKPQKNTSLERLGNEFNNELINQINYNISSSKSNEIRTAYLAKLIMVNDPEAFKKEIKEKNDINR